MLCVKFKGTIVPLPKMFVTSAYARLHPVPLRRQVIHVRPVDGILGVGGLAGEEHLVRRAVGDQHRQPPAATQESQ